MFNQSPFPSSAPVASFSSKVFSIGADKITIGSQTFETEQLAQLLKLLLKEHPELQI